MIHISNKYRHWIQTACHAHMCTLSHWLQMLLISKEKALFYCTIVFLRDHVHVGSASSRHVRRIASPLRNVHILSCGALFAPGHEWSGGGEEAQEEGDKLSVAWLLGGRIFAGDLGGGRGQRRVCAAMADKVTCSAQLSAAPAVYFALASLLPLGVARVPQYDRAGDAVCRRIDLCRRCATVWGVDPLEHTNDHS